MSDRNDERTDAGRGAEGMEQRGRGKADEPDRIDFKALATRRADRDGRELQP